MLEPWRVPRDQAERRGVEFLGTVAPGRIREHLEVAFDVLEETGRWPAWCRDTVVFGDHVVVVDEVELVKHVEYPTTNFSDFLALLRRAQAMAVGRRVHVTIDDLLRYDVTPGTADSIRHALLTADFGWWVRDVDVVEVPDRVAEIEVTVHTVDDAPTPDWTSVRAVLDEVVPVGVYAHLCIF